MANRLITENQTELEELRMLAFLDHAILITVESIPKHLHVSAKYSSLHEAALPRYHFLLEVIKPALLGSGWEETQEEPSLAEMCRQGPTQSLSLMKILAWNCRGAVNLHFCRHFMELKRQHNSHMVIITETRVGGNRAQDIVHSLGFPNSELMDPIGYSGGIWLLWNDHEVSCSIQHVSQQEIYAASRFYLLPPLVHFYYLC